MLDCSICVIYIEHCDFCMIKNIFRISIFSGTQRAFALNNHSPFLQCVYYALFLNPFQRTN